MSSQVVLIQKNYRKKKAFNRQEISVRSSAFRSQSLEKFRFGRVKYFRSF